MILEPLQTSFLALTFCFFLSLWSGPGLISWLKAIKFGQVIREEGPEAHKAKSGTPSMGGVLIFFPLVLVLALIRPGSYEIWLLLGLCCAYAALGFLDDWLIIRRQTNKGLTARQKLFGQTLFAVLFASGLWGLGWRPEVILPSFIPERSLEMGLLYWPWIVFLIVGTANAVNLTDGLDGLAVSTVSLAVVGLAALLIAINYQTMAPAQSDTLVFLGALLGGCLGFLWFNAYPASVFMGDTGSLGLGAALAGVSIISHLDLALALVGAIFVVETLSVMAQVSYFKWTKGKRLLKMSPLHHHLELSGWQETKVVARFSLATILCTIGAFALFVR
ncbi:MAG: phospho-N-acetylmuramoyl-pentapeptide-transferase [Candidatus Sericytochromatia bacterium]|nr:phospho-N-acetylmuramoyl-pentapeptide-transferase [Candidatus Sericytochromatia bacterium]